MATHAQRGSLWRVGAGALFVAAALCGGCSLLFHADAKQCSTTTDCTARGTAFTGYTCNLGTCVAPECTKNTDCASLGVNYTCTTFVCVAPIAMLDGGSEAEAAVGGCMTNADCKADSGTHPEVACDVDTHACLQLTTDDCPILIPSDILTRPQLPPFIFLGAFVTLPTMGGPLTHPTYLNYALALNEFIGNSGGIPAGPGTGLRTPVAVGCDVSLDVVAATQHLINEVHVSSIVAPLPSVTLAQIFSTYAYPANIFMINPLGQDSNLTSLTVGFPPLLWHMLGAPGDYAPAYADFLPIIERYIRASTPWSLGPSAPMKVATVTANATVTNDLAAAVEKVLTWNGGQTIAQNGANYRDEPISSSTLNGTPLSDTNFSNSIQAAAQDLANFQPDVIISFASDEFSTLIQDVELDWTGGVPLPFYLVGPYNMGSTNVQGTVSNVPFNTKRFAGIGVASAADTTVLDKYVTRFLGAYSGRADALGAENYYDAMYFAVDSLIAAGRVSNPDIGTGMTHLISLSSQSKYSVGPADQGNIFSSVAGSTQGTIELIGTLGPPDFNKVTGARNSQGDVYCFIQDVDAGTATPKFDFDYDVLRLTNADGTLPPDGGSPYQGTFPCYPGIQ